MHNISLQTEFDDSLPHVRCDAEQIEQALVALEINAVEAMPHEGLLRITVNAASGDIVTLKIIDTGTGIRDEDIPISLNLSLPQRKRGRGQVLGSRCVRYYRETWR